MRVVCVGAVNQDVKARSAGGIVIGTSNPGRVERTVGGVAANVARTLTRLKVDVTVVSAVGDDAIGRATLAALRAEGVSTDAVTVLPGCSTGSYVAILDDRGELVAGVADGHALESLGPSWVDRALPVLAAADVWVIEANLPVDVIGRLFDLRPREVTIVADPVSVPKANRLARHLERIDVLLPDAAEGAALAGLGDARDRAVDIAVRLRDHGVGIVVLKLGAKGVLVATPQRTGLTPPIPPDEVVDVTGAGDAMAAGYLYAIAKGLTDPVGYGLAAASLTVETTDTVAPAMSVEALEARRSRETGGEPG